MAEANEDAQPKELEKGGVIVKINPLLGITHGGVSIPGVGRFFGGERIAKAQFAKLEKEARNRPTHKAPEGFPLLIESGLSPDSIIEDKEEE